MFERQAQHYVLLAFLLAGLYMLAGGEVLSGQLWGLDTQTWLWIAAATPILHQMAVALLWRAELYHHKMTDWFGDKAFDVFKTIFAILFIGHFMTLILLGISNINTLFMALNRIKAARRLYELTLNVHYPQGIYSDLSRCTHTRHDPGHPDHAIVPAWLLGHERRP